MKTCPVCEGKGVVGRLGEPVGSVELLGKDIPVITMRDQPCKRCNGTGEVAGMARCHNCGWVGPEEDCVAYRGIGDYCPRCFHKAGKILAMVDKR